MSEYTRALQNRKKELETAIMSAESYLEKAPEGTIRITSNGNGYKQFYHVTEENKSSGKYIRKKDVKLVKALIQKEYSKAFMKQAQDELAMLEDLLSNNEKCAVEDSEQLIHEGKRGYISQYLLSDDLYVKHWLDEKYEMNRMYPEGKVYSTKKGEMVRSKSEVILADMYYDLGIPYRYECALVLKDGRVKFPDFTVLDVNRRQIIYHEHLGLLDDENYRKENLLKINEYRKNGIYIGKNLMITFETQECPLNVREIRECIKEMLCYNE